MKRFYAFISFICISLLASCSLSTENSLTKNYEMQFDVEELLNLPSFVEREMNIDAEDIYFENVTCLFYDNEEDKNYHSFIGTIKREDGSESNFQIQHQMNELSLVMSTIPNSNNPTYSRINLVELCNMMYSSLKEFKNVFPDDSIYCAGYGGRSYDNYMLGASKYRFIFDKELMPLNDDITLNGHYGLLNVFEKNSSGEQDRIDVYKEV